MIFYFTGTGNSLWVAKALSEALGEQLVSIADELHKEKDGWVYPVRPDEKILFVYPVHSWGPAVSVTRFISRLTLNGYTGQSVYSVSTCGDECGYTDRLIGKALEKRAISLTAAYSVIMPNNYILLPGFDVDDKDVEERKLQDAPGTCGRDYRSDPGAWAGRFVSYRKHARFEKLLDLSSFCPSGYRK